MIIGITGHPASGKDSAAEYFEEKGFMHISGGDLLREMMKKRGISTDRAHVHEFVKEMRAREGNSFPAQEVANALHGNAVTSGFRNLAEVEVFRKKFGKNFTLLAIDAPVRVRYERIRERQRTGDDINFERFREEEDREREEASGSHEVDRVIAAADVTIKNAGTKEEFFAKLDAFLNRGADMVE